MVASLKDREQEGQLEVYSVPLSLILLNPSQDVALE